MTEDDPLLEVLAWTLTVMFLILLAIWSAGCTLMKIEPNKTTCSFEPLPTTPELYISHPESEQTCMSDADWQAVRWYVQQMRGQYAAAAVRCAEGAK